MRTTTTVIIPTFNRASLVGTAIDSALSQETPNMAVEVIVIDDGSTDSTPSFLETYGPRILALSTHNRGAAAARNVGLEAARGKWVKFLDSDDLLLPNTLAAEVALGAATQADIVVTGWGEARVPSFEPQLRHRAPSFRDIPDDLLGGRAVPTSSALYASSLAGRVRWDESLRKLDDWDYFCSAAMQATRITTLDHTAYLLRHHDGARLTQSSGMLNAIEHHLVLSKLEASLLAHNMLTEARRLRLAQYLYKELRVLELHDARRFDAACAHILRLDPSFQPRDEEEQWYMRLAARMIGFRNSARVHGMLKRMLKRRVTA